MIIADVSVLLGAFKLAMTIVAVVLVDRLGRRPLLLSGVSGMVLSLVVLGSTTPGSPFSGLVYPALASSASVGALLLFVGCYQVGSAREFSCPSH